MEKMLRAKTLIYERDITQIELARALKISETRLSRILNGRDQARPVELSQLANELGVSETDLVS